MKLKEFLERADKRTSLLDVIAIFLFVSGGMSIYFAVYYKIFGEIDFLPNIIMGSINFILSIFVIRYSIKQDKLNNPEQDIKVWEVEPKWKK